MMTRIKGKDHVHFRNPANPLLCLCGAPAGTRTADLFDATFNGWPTTTEPVDCPSCARVACAVRNEPYNTLVAGIDRDVLFRGVHDAVLPDGETAP